MLNFILLLIMSLGILSSCRGTEGPIGSQGEQSIQGEPEKDGYSPEIILI